MTPLWDVSYTLPHVFLELISALGVRCCFVIVLATVVEYKLGIVDKFFWGTVIIGFQLGFHSYVC